MVQVFAPISFAAEPNTPKINADTSVDLDLLNTVGIQNSGEISNGWFDSANGVGNIDLLYRDAAVIATENWSAWTGQSNTLDGWYILTHTYPVPTEWFGELADSGIDCFSFLPPNGFHCELEGQTTSELEELDVQGIVKMDSVDKIRENLVRGITGMEMTSVNLYVTDGYASVNLILSGTELPQGIELRDDIVVEYHQERYATVLIQTSALQWLAA
ncbi:MAG: hypothetical protein QMC53_06100, partial [Candidatus Poseidoniaceae archaeon]